MESFHSIRQSYSATFSPSPQNSRVLERCHPFSQFAPSKISFASENNEFKYSDLGDNYHSAFFLFLLFFPFSFTFHQSVSISIFSQLCHLVTTSSLFETLITTDNCFRVRCILAASARFAMSFNWSPKAQKKKRIALFGTDFSWKKVTTNARLYDFLYLYI